MAKKSIHPETTLGHVHLTVSNMKQSLDFYQHTLGFTVDRQVHGVAYLGAGEDDLLVLTERPNGRSVTDTTGLYHFAILLHSRLALAQSLQQIVARGTVIEGFADHFVSEAIYLPDPDGHGIEIYHDRPRSTWGYVDGQLQMGTAALDVDNLLAELQGQTDPWHGLDADTVIGHVHLHVADLAQAEAFYRDVLGFDLMVSYGESASFLSAGRYHHHLGLNTWSGTALPPPDALGLHWFVIRLPNEREVERTAERIRQAGFSIEDHREGLLVFDPVQNGIILTT